MIAFVFPGQGSQSVGMGKAFSDACPAAHDVFEAANAALGFAFTRIMFEGPAAELALTSNTQPAMLIASVAAAAACAARGLHPAIVAGHSLGEYSALVVAGALPFADAVRVVRRRGELMQQAVPVGVGAMAAIMGLSLTAVEALCGDAARGEVVEVANVNGPHQVVIAGHKTAVERAVALASARGGKKSVVLPVSAPFHCSLMQPAVDGLAPELEKIAVKDPTIPIVRNVDGELTRRAADVVPSLLRQITAPVRWTDCVQRLIREGAGSVVEVGSGRILSALVKRIADGVRVSSVDDPGGLDALVAAGGGST